MAVEILPAVLAYRFQDLAKRFRLAKALSSSVHLDIMDGHFVATKSVGQSAISRLQPSGSLELHLMTKYPELWLPVVIRLKIHKVIVHVELGRRLNNIINLYRGRRRSVMLAINPRTSLARLKPWIDRVQGVVVMGVHPGKYRADWQSTTPTRIKTIRRLYPKMMVACDGGLNPTTIPQALEAGVQRLVIGSYLQYHPQPKQAWRKLRQLAGRAEK